jgi:hypothetical protein
MTSLLKIALTFTLVNTDTTLDYDSTGRQRPSTYPSSSPQPEIRELDPGWRIGPTPGKG